MYFVQKYCCFTWVLWNYIFWDPEIFGGCQVLQKNSKLYYWIYHIEIHQGTNFWVFYTKIQYYL